MNDKQKFEEVLNRFRYLKSLRAGFNAPKPYKIKVTPGQNPKIAAEKLSRLIIDKAMPRNAGGVHVLCGPGLTSLLIPFFERNKSTVLLIDSSSLKSNGMPCTITEVG